MAVLETQAREHVAEMFRFPQEEAQGLELQEVERSVFAKLLPLGRLMVEVFLVKKGTGK